MTSTFASPTGWLRSPGQPVFGAAWPEPEQPQKWPVPAAAGVGVLAALLLPGGPRVGVNVLICALAATIPVAGLGYRRGRAGQRRYPLGRVAVALGLVALGLAAVAAVRASEWLAWGCALAALCLGAAVALDVRRWKGVFVTVPLFIVAVGRSLPWARRAARMEHVRSRSMPWLTGLAIGSISACCRPGCWSSPSPPGPCSAAASPSRPGWSGPRPRPGPPASGIRPSGYCR